jgi:hypothetical protein
MIKTFRILFVLVVVAACGRVMYAQGKGDVSGMWDFAVESPQGTVEAVADIKVDGERVSGTIKSHMGEHQFTGTIKGNQLVMIYSVKAQDNDITITITGTVSGDSIKGTGDAGGFAQFDWTAKRHQGDKAAAASASTDISGSWVFDVETGQGSGSPNFTFKQDGEKLTGHYQGALGEGPVEGTVRNGAINFRIKLDAQGQDVTIVYTGTIEKDGMKGTVKLGDLGDGTWTGKRQ